MTGRRSRLAVGVVAIGLALVVAACGSSSSSTSSKGTSAASTTKAASKTGPPYVVHRPWGTFKLSPRIAQKVESGQPINYVFSYLASGLADFSSQMQIGYQRGCKEGKAIMPLNCSAIAPVQIDANKQISQIEAKLAANQIDCASIQPTSINTFTAITNKMLDQGIPVFTVSVTSNGHEFTNFTQDPVKEGKSAGEAVLKWMKDTGNKPKVFAVSSQDPTTVYGQGRMKNFRETIQKAMPDAKFVTTEKNALVLPLDPAKGYDAAKAFLSSHPNVQFFENSDDGGNLIDKAIKDTGRVGKVWSLGWNPTVPQLDAIDQGIQAAVMDQAWTDQSAFGGKACATFLKTGKILPNTQRLIPVFKADTAAARKKLATRLAGGK
jgi:ABC-type sugar transport system substrate-binding protein